MKKERGYVSSASVRRSLEAGRRAPTDLSHSADSGGPGTYSQLLILKECMNRLATDLGIGEEDVYPADYFDLMGGVGFGGYAYN
jgi:hypothetical protein